MGILSNSRMLILAGATAASLGLQACSCWPVSPGSYCRSMFDDVMGDLRFSDPTITSATAGVSVTAFGGLLPSYRKERDNTGKDWKDPTFQTKLNGHARNLSKGDIQALWGQYGDITTRMSKVFSVILDPKPGVWAKDMDYISQEWQEAQEEFVLKPGMVAEIGGETYDRIDLTSLLQDGGSLWVQDNTLTFIESMAEPGHFTLVILGYKFLWHLQNQYGLYRDKPVEVRVAIRMHAQEGEARSQKTFKAKGKEIIHTWLQEEEKKY